ncbi:MAG TPA: aconitate hydratase AcnA [Verrucomicrobiota bacterium]|mgnify:CR=1 FL=1|nr:aconitate hydratase AcnA [Verrucomicrobiota bacterium]
MNNTFNSIREFDSGNGEKALMFSLPALEEAGLGQISRLPISLRIVLEAVLRNVDGRNILIENVEELAAWQPNAERTKEIPFIVSRILLQDFTGVPLLVDLAAMRSAVDRFGKDPNIIEPLAPVDLVIDHSVQIDYSGTPDSLEKNMEMEFKRNNERYRFLKWGTQAFKSLKIIPPGTGIIHQINLEYLAKGVIKNSLGFVYPDTVLGTDSHTTMINALGVVGWGVGGIEAEAGMLGQPIYFLAPDVVGVYMFGYLPEGATATDIALTVTQVLRKAKVVGRFVEFFGPGAANLPVVDRAVISNMAPEYGATMGFFPIDEECVKFLRMTGRTEEHCRLYKNYYKAQGMFGMPQAGDINYSQIIEIDLSKIKPSISGPKRPQDRINLDEVKIKFNEVLTKPINENGYGKSSQEIGKRVKIKLDANDRAGEFEIGNGSIIIASITSCTNTSNPVLMLAAGLLAKKAVEKGLRPPAYVKTSLTPGSQAVTRYLIETGLQYYLDKLGFYTTAYGCATCIGNSGPINTVIENAIVQNDIVVASVLSGNRNFEARIHPNIKANFLMSPPLVVAYALAGRIDIDFSNEPIGQGNDGKPVYLKDIWHTKEEISSMLKFALKPEIFKDIYAKVSDNKKWDEINTTTGKLYKWDEKSTYIQEPPFFKNFSIQPGKIKEITGACAIGIFGDSITTDHISPAGSIKKNSPAGQYLIEKGVPPEEFNTYGARRGNDRIMTRGTFANVRIKNLMVPGVEGGYTRYQPTGEIMSIYDAAMKYIENNIPLLVFAGYEYGTGSSRDWAAKGTFLLGIKAVIAQSFERIHRSNLVGMGVLPLQFKEGVNAQTLGLDGSEILDILGLDNDLTPRQELALIIHRKNGSSDKTNLICRIDTPIEVEYYRHGGILMYVLRQILLKS